MLYASFRCLMKAPVSVIWQRLNEKVRASPSALKLKEQILVNPERNEIVLRLVDAQQLSGERRFVIRSDREGAETFVDAILKWNAEQADIDQQNLAVHVDALVRDVLLELKREAEAS